VLGVGQPTQRAANYTARSNIVECRFHRPGDESVLGIRISIRISVSTSIRIRIHIHISFTMLTRRRRRSRRSFPSITISISIRMRISIIISIRMSIRIRVSTGDASVLGERVNLASTRYCHYQYWMVHGIHKWGRGRVVLRNRRAIVLQSVTACRWAGAPPPRVNPRFVHKIPEVKHYLVKAKGQPTQTAANYTARSNIEPAQSSLSNGQSAPRPGGDRDVGRGAGRYTPSTASESPI